MRSEHCPNCDCHWCGWTPDEKYPWWSWENANPDVVARRSDGVVMEQIGEGWRAGDWQSDWLEHQDALAAYDEHNPREGGE